MVRKWNISLNCLSKPEIVNYFERVVGFYWSLAIVKILGFSYTNWVVTCVGTDRITKTTSLKHDDKSNSGHLLKECSELFFKRKYLNLMERELRNLRHCLKTVYLQITSWETFVWMFSLKELCNIHQAGWFVSDLRCKMWIRGEREWWAQKTLVSMKRLGWSWLALNNSNQTAQSHPPDLPDHLPHLAPVWFPEPTILLTCGRDRDLCPGPTPEVHDSRTSRQI